MKNIFRKTIVLIITTIGLILFIFISFISEAQTKVFQIDAGGTLKTGLVSYWKLEDVNDYYASNNLSNTGTVVFESGEVGNAANSGTSNSSKWLNTASNMGIDGGVISIAGWFKINTAPATNTFIVLADQNSASSKTGYGFWYHDSGGTKKLQFVREQVGGSLQGPDITTTLTIGIWYHLVLTYDGTNVQGWINGVSQGIVAASGNGSYASTPNNFSIFNNASFPSSFNQGSSGLADEIGIWSKKLSNTEIADLYNGGAGQTMVTTPNPTSDCTGGTITHSGGNTIHTFTGNGVLVCSLAHTAKILVVAGGGGGGSEIYDDNGGGGGGGTIYNSSFSVTSNSHTVVIGAGGAVNTQGATSSFGSIVATGGGNGGVNRFGPAAGSGGSGGGGSAGGWTGASGISGQGYAGGDGDISGNDAGGGGGATAAGTIGTGGAGLTSSISGTSTCYGGGGGGASYLGPIHYGGCGIAGGGTGAIDKPTKIAAVAGVANTGNGGGGSDDANNGAAGGSGVVIVSYITSPPTPATVDWNNSNVQEITLTNDRIFTFTNGKSGGLYTLLVNQDATGSRIVTWPSYVKWSDSTAPILSTTPNAIDIIKFVYNGTDYLENGTTLNIH